MSTALCLSGLSGYATQGATYAVKCEVKPRQRAIIKAGGLLNYTRQASKA